MSIDTTFYTPTSWETQTEEIKNTKGPDIVSHIIYSTYGQYETGSFSIIHISINCFASLSVSWVNFMPNSSKPYPTSKTWDFTVNSNNTSTTPSPLFGDRLDRKFLTAYITNTFNTFARDLKKEMDAAKPKDLQNLYDVRIQETIQALHLTILYSDGVMKSLLPLQVPLA
jgi:hypothetical protein